jgi:peptidylprolyl isomerase
MHAKMGDTVRVHYEGTLDDRTVFSTTIDRGPAEITIGEGNLIPAFEEAIIGMAPGESREIEIPTEEAFGAHRPELVQTIDRGELTLGLKPEVGERLQAIDVEGRTVYATIKDVSEHTVTLDGNHNYAGQNLRFEIQLIEIIDRSSQR